MIWPLKNYQFHFQLALFLFVAAHWSSCCSYIIICIFPIPGLISCYSLYQEWPSLRYLDGLLLCCIQISVQMSPSLRKCHYSHPYIWHRLPISFYCLLLLYFSSWYLQLHGVILQMYLLVYFLSPPLIVREKFFSTLFNPLAKCQEHSLRCNRYSINSSLV